MIRDDKWNQELDIAELLNTAGCVRLFGVNDDPSLLTIRTYEGQVFNLKWTGSIDRLALNLVDTLENLKTS